MTLTGSTRIGPYEILSPIGSGGMGEVYRARDPRLDREVAIKILPGSYASSEDRLARFEQEARAAGQLNHPNVVAVYDIGTFEGTPFVVTELLEGETLRERLRTGALAPRKALEIATQIARGLAAAHDKGIIHRDIKPENIFLTRDGRVKVLDFGLAKIESVVPSGDAGSEIATLLAHTSPGVVMGTVGYMSPEQVRGLVVDARADIFSVGAVLYEMVTGARAFGGDSAVEVLNSILKEEPPEITTTAAQLPPGLDRLIRHCLEKNPEQRFQSSSDLAFDLEALSLYSTPSFLASGAVRRHTRRIPWRAVAAALTIAALVAGAFWAGDAYRAAEPRPTVGYQQITFRKGKVTAARFAPDGQTIIYTAAWDGKPPEMYLARPGSPESRSYDLSDAHLLGVSTKGDLAVVHDKVLARMAFTGGAPREVLDRVIAADWRPGTDDLAVAHFVDGKYRLEFPIGKVIHQSDGVLDAVRFSPDGKRLAFTSHPIPGDDRGRLMVVTLEGEVAELADGWSSLGGLAWAPGGREVWFAGAKTGANRSLWAVSLDGEERLVADTAGSFTLHDVSADGRVLASRDNARSEVIGNAPGDDGERNLSWLDGSVGADLSDDGRTLLFSEQIHGGGTNYSVYLRETDGAPPIRIGEGTATSLSPDGKWALSILPTTPPKLAILPTGVGTPRVVVDHGFEQIQHARWLPDGSRVVLAASEPGTLGRSYMLDAETGALAPITPDGVRGTLVTPDGASLAAVDVRSGVWSLFPLDGGDPTPMVGLVEGDVPIRFAADGRSVYVRESKQFPVVVARVALATGRREKVVEAEPSDMTGVGPYPSRVVITPDGATYAYSFSRHLSELFLVDGLGA